MVKAALRIAMQLARPAIALDPRRFGRCVRGSRASSAIVADLRLFATTFIAGFVFVSILIA
jgi:hypothetical protein